MKMRRHAKLLEFELRKILRRYRVGDLIVKCSEDAREHAREHEQKNEKHEPQQNRYSG